jgi:hypothetical protein
MGNIRDVDLGRYLDRFHETYRQTAEALLPDDVRAELLRLPLMDSGVRGYISTQYGAGYEYVPDGIGFSVHTGSGRIEDVFLQAPAAVRRLRTIGVRIANTHSTFERVSVSNLYPFRMEGDAAVRLIDFHADGIGWKRDVVFAELSSNRSLEYWSEHEAVTRAKDELLVALVDVRQLERQRGSHGATLATLVTKFRERHVLLCGDFKSGRDRLEAIRETLEGHGYVVTLLDEIPDDPYSDLRNKFRAVANVVRFVVIDNSSRGGQMVELELATQLSVVTIVLIARGSDRSFMTVASALRSSVMSEAEYGDDDIGEVLQLQTSWAEATLARLSRDYEKSFPWRGATAP